MSREKQIEEMASDLENHTCMSQFQAEISARTLYILGYRKQSEAEWIVVYEYNDYRMRKEAKIACSGCGHKPKYEGYLSDMNYCPNCGAKMGGGVE